MDKKALYTEFVNEVLRGKTVEELETVDFKNHGFEEDIFEVAKNGDEIQPAYGVDAKNYIVAKGVSVKADDVGHSSVFDANKIDNSVNFPIYNDIEISSDNQSKYKELLGRFVDKEKEESKNRIAEQFEDACDIISGKEVNTIAVWKEEIYLPREIEEETKRLENIFDSQENLISIGLKTEEDKKAFHKEVGEDLKTRFADGKYGKVKYTLGLRSDLPEELNLNSRLANKEEISKALECYKGNLGDSREKEEPNPNDFVFVDEDCKIPNLEGQHKKIFIVKEGVKAKANNIGENVVFDLNDGTIKGDKFPNLKMMKQMLSKMKDEGVKLNNTHGAFMNKLKGKVRAR